MLDQLSDKWSLQILATLDAGPTHFNALLRSLPGLSPRTLTATLRRLGARKLISRSVADAGAPRVTYALTDLGLSLREPIAALARWSERHE